MKKLLCLLLCLTLALGLAPLTLAAEPEGVAAAGAYTPEDGDMELSLDGSSEGVSIGDLDDYTHDSTYSSKTILKGIDVSVFQGDIDWGAVRGDGVEFAIVRAGGRYVGSGDLYADSKLTENLQGAIGQGIAAGAYFFSQAITEDEAREEAAEALRLLGDYARLLKLPIYIDMEYFSGSSGRLYDAGLTADEHTRIALAFCRAIEDAGYEAGVYVGLCTFPINAEDITAAGYEVWHAQWYTHTTVSPVYTVWQCSALGSVAGIRGSVDLNFRYVDPEKKDDSREDTVSFSDVPEGAWYQDSVSYVVKNGLFFGMGNGKFAPNAAMNREMFVTVLYRLAGSPEVTGESPFSDVADSTKWYYNAVCWGAQTEIISGIGDGLFGVGRALSRQEMVTLFARYAETVGLTLDTDESLDGFPDGANTASWAAEAMRWAIGNGVISGVADKGKTKLDPKSTTTRAQVATVLERFAGLLDEE